MSYEDFSCKKEIDLEKKDKTQNKEYVWYVKLQIIIVLVYFLIKTKGLC